MGEERGNQGMIVQKLKKLNIAVLWTYVFQEYTYPSKYYINENEIVPANSIKLKLFVSKKISDKKNPTSFLFFER